LTIRQDQKKAFNEALKLVESTGKTLQQFYAQALDEINKEIAAFKLKIDKGLLSDAQKLKYERLNKLYKVIDQALKDLFKVQKNVISQGYSSEFMQAYYKMGFAIERDVNTRLLSDIDYNYTLGYTQVNPGYVATTFKEPIAGMTFLQRNKVDRERLQFKIQGIIERATQTGLTPKQVATELQAIDDVFAQSFKKALTVARTELLRAYSYGQEDAINQAKAVGVEGNDIWDATLDRRTRPQHAAMDQKKADAEGWFRLPNGDRAKGPRMPGLSAANAVNCRCKKLYLPFGVIPNQRGRGGRKPNGDWSKRYGGMDYEQWAKTLSKAPTVPDSLANKRKFVKKLT
jgi:hypothetical protein